MFVQENVWCFYFTLYFLVIFSGGSLSCNSCLSLYAVRKLVCYFLACMFACRLRQRSVNSYAQEIVGPMCNQDHPLGM